MSAVLKVVPVNAALTAGVYLAIIQLSPSFPWDSARQHVSQHAGTSHKHTCLDTEEVSRLVGCC